MRKEFFLLLIIVLIPAIIFAQGRRDHKGPREKIEQLEKVKLIDALNMDEQTTLKFFARRNELRNRVDSLNDSLDTIVDVLEAKFPNGNESDYKSMVNKYLNIEKQIAAEHSQFISSLYDILTPEQVAKLVVFEKRFREEVRRIIMRGKMSPPGDGPDMR
jgi:hypothetical protein